MALGSSIFHPDFAAHLKPVIASSFKATVLIERNSTVAPDWDSTLGDFAGGGMIQLFQGTARVQKVAKTVRRENVFDSADMQTFRVQLMPEDNQITPTDPLLWQSNDRVRILSCVASPMLEHVLMYVVGWPGSSNQLVETLTCRYDAKQELEV